MDISPFTRLSLYTYIYTQKIPRERQGPGQELCQMEHGIGRESGQNLSRLRGPNIPRIRSPDNVPSWCSVVRD